MAAEIANAPKAHAALIAACAAARTTVTVRTP